MDPDSSSHIGDYCRLHFRVFCETKQGQQLALKINEGPLIELVTSPEAYPVWFNKKPFVLPRSGVVTTTDSSDTVTVRVDSIKYKYGLIDGANLKCFESLPDSFMAECNNQGDLDISRSVVLDELDTVVEDVIADFNSAFYSEEMHGFQLSEHGSDIWSKVWEEKAVHTSVPFTLQHDDSTDQKEAASYSVDALIDASLAAVPKDMEDLRSSSFDLPENPPEKRRMSCSSFEEPTKENSSLYIVCYHLPVVVTRIYGEDDNPEDGSAWFDITWAESLIAKSADEFTVANKLETRWVGTVHFKASSSLTERERMKLSEELADLRCIPIFLDTKLDDMAYKGFCKEVMWPIMHNVDQLDQIHAAWNCGGGKEKNERDILEWNKKEAEYFRAYRNMNLIFANCLVDLLDEEVRPGQELFNTIWVHDYHLMLLPAFLRDAMTKATIYNDNRSLDSDRESMPPKMPSMSSNFGGFDQTRQRANSNTTGFRRRNSDATHITEQSLEDYIYPVEFNEIFGADISSPSVSSHGRDAFDVSLHSILSRESTGAKAISGDNAKCAVQRARERAVRETLNNIGIIFFMHIPFPTSQMFRTLAVAGELLLSMTCADVLGFHAFDHARHFLNAAKRMLGMQSVTKSGGLLTLNAHDREVIVSMSHVSIETGAIDAAMVHPETLALVDNYRQKYTANGYKIIVGMDACQRLSGISMKLAGYDKYLTDNPEIKESCITPNNPRQPQQQQPISGMIANLHSTVVKPGLSGFVNMSNYHQTHPSNSSFATNGSTTSFHKSGLETNRVILIQKALRSSARLKDQNVTSSDIRKMVHDINMKHRDVTDPEPTSGELLLTGPKVDYEEVDGVPSLNQRVALWMVADEFLLTPVREGLNLMPLEYIYARRNLSNAGALIVSEFSTCSNLLSGSIKINPFSAQNVADAIDKGLHMSIRDRTYRRQRDISFISNHPSSAWTKKILSDLQGLRTAKKVLSNTAKHKSRAKKWTSGNANKLPDPFPSLLAVKEAYESAVYINNLCRVSQTGSRVFVFDYGGTLLYKEKNDIFIKSTLSAISGRRPTDRVMTALRRLSNDPRNIVMVVTGLTKLKLGDTFAGMKNLTLVTSNGMVYSWGDNIARYFKNELNGDNYESFYLGGSKCEHSLAPIDDNARVPPGTDASYTLPNETPLSSVGKTESFIAKSLRDENRAWEFLEYGIDWEAVAAIAMPIINKFTYRTNGTCKTPRIPGIGWSYFGADPDWGKRQAEQLTVELLAALANFDVTVTSLIQGSIEVVPSMLHKGIMVRTLLDKVCAKRGGRLPGFCMIIGDDISDDKMFDAVYQKISDAGPSAEVRRMKLFTSTISRRESAAQFYVSTLREVEAVLTTLATSSTTSSLEPSISDSLLDAI